MANTKISEDPWASTLTGIEILPVIQSGSNKKVTVETMLADRSVVQFNSTTGSFEVNNVSTPGSISVAWAEFVNLAPSDYVNYHLLITNVYGSTLGDGGLLVRGSTSGWVQTDNYLVTTFAALPTAATKYKGWRAMLTDLNNVEVLCSGTAWVKGSAGRVLLFNRKFGTLASPTLSVTAAGKFNVGTDPVIPAGLLNSSSELQIEAFTLKTGTAATASLGIYLGTTGNNTDSEVCGSVTSAATSPFHMTPAPNILFTGASSLITTMAGVTGGNGGQSVFADRSTNIAVGSAMTMTFYAKTTTNPDSFSLIGYRVWWVA